MNKEKLLFIIIGAIIGGAFVWFTVKIPGVSIANSIPWMMRTGSDSIQNTTLNANVLDVHFIEQMIPHHEDAITMAVMAMKKSKRTEIKQLAQNIIDSQSMEIDQMKAWYKMWFGKNVSQDLNVMMGHGMSHSGGLHMGMMGNQTDIERLSNAEDFDREFLEEMIPHHQMAVMMATMLKNGTGRSEMKQLAQNIIQAQSEEISQMRTWLREWE